MTRTRMKLFAAVCLIAPLASAAELELRFATLERIVAGQMFTQEGRHYVRGNKTTRCQFAYLESPHIDAEGSRLRVNAKFSGRSALDMFGGCMGVGDSFDLTMTATPAAKNGAIGFKDVNIATQRDSFYIRRVRAAMVRSVSSDFKLDIRDQAKKLLSQAGEVTSFDLADVRVTADALVLVIDFKLVVK